MTSHLKPLNSDNVSVIQRPIATPTIPPASIRRVEFCAHDENEYRAWHEQADGRQWWVMVNKYNQAWKRDSLVAILSEMERRSGVPVNQFTIIEA